MPLFNMDDIYEVADLMKCLSHPKRLMIIAALLERNMSVSEIAVAIDSKQSQTSHLLKELKASKIVDCKTVRQHGANFNIYHICDDRVHSVIANLKTQYCTLHK